MASRPLGYAIVIISAALVLTLLALCIHNELSNKGEKENLSRLIILTTLDQTVEQTNNVKELYDHFIQRPNVEFEGAYYKAEEETLKLLQSSGLIKDQSKDSDWIKPDIRGVTGVQGVLDTMFAWFSPEGTEHSTSDIETLVKQIFVAVFPQDTLITALGKLTSDVENTQVFIVEVWPKYVKMFAMKNHETNLIAIRELVSLQLLQSSLCPSSGPKDFVCYPLFEARENNV